MASDEFTAARRGRVRDEAKRAAIVRAALRIVEEGGLGALTMEAIATRSQVSKATVYKWWDHRAAVALEGLLDELDPALRWPDSGDFAVDLARQVGVLTDALTGPRGQVFCAVIGAGQADDGVRRAFVEGFTEPRRADARAAFERGRERGQLRDVDPEVAIDLVYGPLYYRLLLGHRPLDRAFAADLVAAALQGIARPPAEPPSTAPEAPAVAGRMSP